MRLPLETWPVLLAVAAGFLAPRALPAAAPFSGRCTAVLDGDTIEVLHGRRTERIRLEGIDCPERGQPFSRRARQFTSALLFGHDVEVLPKTIDSYGRMVARVRVGGKDASMELVRAGLAWHYRHYSHDRELAAAEARSRAERLGVWSRAGAVPPWEYRARHREESFTVEPR
jgi:endonuclease YncB( thermonuclease family)